MKLSRRALLLAHLLFCLLLTLAAVCALLLLGISAVRVSSHWHSCSTQQAALGPYLALWRALLNSLMVTLWIATWRRQRTAAGRQRLMRLGLIGFTGTALLELSRA